MQGNNAYKIQNNNHSWGIGKKNIEGLQGYWLHSNS